MSRRNKDVIIFFGAPGVGKGTYSSLLSKDLGYTKISPGDEIRKIINNQDESTYDLYLLNEIKKRVAAGKLVSDDLVIEIIKMKMQSRRCKGVVLDGFPRTKAQMEWIHNQFPTAIGINMILKYEVLLEGLLSRRACIDCGTSYNIRSYYKNGYEIDEFVPDIPSVQSLPRQSG